MLGTVRIFRFTGGHLDNFSEEIGQIQILRKLVRKCSSGVRGCRMDMKRIKRRAMYLIPRGVRAVSVGIEWENEFEPWKFELKG